MFSFAPEFDFHITSDTCYLVFKAHWRYVPVQLLNHDRVRFTGCGRKDSAKIAPPEQDLGFGPVDRSSNSRPELELFAPFFTAADSR